MVQRNHKRVNLCPDDIIRCPNNMKTNNEKHVLAAKKLIDIIPRLMQFIVAALKSQPSLLPMTHYRILRILQKSPMSLSDLARKLMISKASLSETIQLLIEKGWIERMPHEKDARKFILKTSIAGQEQILQVDGEVVQIVSEKLILLSPEEIDSFMNGFQVVDQVLQSGERKLQA